MPRAGLTGGVSFHTAIPGKYLNHWKQKTYILRFRKHKPNKINDICFFECLEQGNFSVSCWKIWFYICESSNFNFFKFKYLSAFRELLGQAFHTTFGLRSIGNLARHVGQLATFTAHDAADERGKNRHMLTHTTAQPTRIALFQGPQYGTIAPMVVTHRIHLMIKWVFEMVYTMRQPRLNVHSQRGWKSVRYWRVSKDKHCRRISA